MAWLSFHFTFILGVILTFVNASTITSSPTSINLSSSTSSLPSSTTATRASSLKNIVASTTLSSNTASALSSSLQKEYSPLSTSSLPVVRFVSGNNYFDYLLQVGGQKQELGLRLDVLEGEVWLPASTAFIQCSATSKSSYSRTYTTITYETDLDSYTSLSGTQLTSLTTADSSLASSSSSSFAYTVPMVETVYSRSCASIGVYHILDSIYAAFIDIYNNVEVSLEDATTYMRAYLSEILVSGVWAVDTFIMTFRSPTLETLEFANVPFVYANFSDVGVGSLALGISPASYGYKYNFISNFVINGLISTNSYSLALGAYNSTYPQLLLGGIDKNLIYDDPQSSSSPLMALFDFVPVFDESGLYVPGGGLTNTVPAFPIYGWGVTSSVTGQSVVFSSSYNDRTEIADYPKPAIFDSRHNYNFIPYSTLVQIAIELDAYYSSDLGIWLADCSVGNAGTIDMYLGNYTIHMAISNFLNPAIVNNTNLVFSSGDSACYLTFLPDYYMGYSLMGTPLLKNIYLAIDNENRKMGISQLQDQLKDMSIDTSKATRVEQNNGVPLNDVASTDTQSIHFGHSTIDDKELSSSETDATQTQITHGVSSFSHQQLNRTMTITTSTTVDGSRVSAYKTVVTASNVFQSETTTKEREFYAIESDVIPFAQRFASATSLTLTIPKYMVFTDTSVQSTEVYISDGEVYLQTNDGANGGGTGVKKTQSTETETTIYAFSSLVVSKVSSSKSSGAGSRMHVPTLLHFETSKGGLYHGLRVAGFFSFLVLCVIVFF